MDDEEVDLAEQLKLMSQLNKNVQKEGEDGEGIIDNQGYDLSLIKRT